MSRQSAVAPEQGPWYGEQLTQAFEVTGYRCPLIDVTRLSDGKRGTLTRDPRTHLYSNFREVPGGR